MPQKRSKKFTLLIKVNEQRELTQQFTKRYLEDQLLVTLAARAAEELAYGLDEMSSINQRRLVMARRIVQKLVVSGNMEIVPSIGHQTLSVPWRHGRSQVQVMRYNLIGMAVKFVDFLLLNYNMQYC